jgi:zinc protease
MLRAAVLGLILALAAAQVEAAPASSHARGKAMAAMADRIPPIAYTHRTLANGLQVYAVLDRTTPNVTVQVWYGVGSKDDPAGRSGFAHLFEHMMFKATRDFPAESIDRFTEDVGGMNNASTADDFTNYYEVVPANHLERLIWVESERLGALVVDEANFKSERDVVKEELRQRVLAAPYGRLFSLYLPQASYTTHPYRRPGIGSIEELDAATLDDVRAFHNAYYRPDNAALVVVGNFDPRALDAWVDRYLGPLTNPAQPLQRVTATEPPRAGPGTFTGYGPNVPLPAVAITWLGARAADPDAPALKVLDAVLSGGKSSRLYDALVYRQQVSAQVLSNADLPQQPGMFMVGSIAAGGHTIDENERSLLAQVARLRDAPPTPAELAKAKTGLVTGKQRERETIEGRGFALGYALRTAGDAAQANRELSDLQKVTAADVQRAARKYLADDRRMTIRYLPESARPKGETAKAETAAVVASAPYTGPVSELAPAGQRVAPPPLGKPVTPMLPRPVEKTLANGLRVIVARSSDLPLVTANLTLKVGAWADPPGLAGTAGMTADMLTEGTKTRGAQAIAGATEALGANLESSGGQESSAVTLNVMPGKLTQAMAIMADIARNPAFAKEELERQRAQSLDGLSVAYQEPGQLAGFAASPVIFAGTPFGHTPGGTPASIARLAPADLARIHARYYRPDNAILVMTGAITPAQGFALARRAFGDWKAPATPAPVPPDIAPHAAPRAVAIDLPGTGQAAVVVLKSAIPRSAPDYYPGVVANTVLGGGYSARMNEEIRVKRGLSYGAGSALTARRTTGLFRASAQTKNESAPQVLDLVRAEMTRLGAEPASAEELTARKSGLVGEFGRSLATTDGLASILGNLALYGVPLAELNAYTGKVEAVTPAEVQAFARARLDPAQASVIVAGDGKAFVDGLKTRLPGLEVIPASDLDLDQPGLRKTR